MITFFASAMALAMAGCSADGPETAAQYPLERFTLQVGANIYHANIDQEAGTVTVGQIKYGGQVTAVGCYLADGAQIFVRGTELSSLLEQLRMIRDDLFFNKDVVIGLDICDIGPFDWRAIFGALGAMRVNGIMLALVHDDGDASDFVGRVFACLGAWPDGMNAELQFAAGLMPNRIEQAIRLTQTMQPDMLSRCMFFVGDMRM